MKNWQFICIMVAFGIAITILIIGNYRLNVEFDKLDKLFDDFNQEQIEKIKQNK